MNTTNKTIEFMNDQPKKSEQELKQEFIFYKKLKTYTDTIRVQPNPNAVLSDQQKKMFDQQQQEKAKQAGSDVVEFLTLLTNGKNQLEMDKEFATLMSGDDNFSTQLLKFEIDEYQNQVQEIQQKIKEYHKLSNNLNEIYEDKDDFLEFCNQSNNVQYNNNNNNVNEEEEEQNTQLLDDIQQNENGYASQQKMSQMTQILSQNSLVENPINNSYPMGNNNNNSNSKYNRNPQMMPYMQGNK